MKRKAPKKSISKISDWLRLEDGKYVIPEETAEALTAWGRKGLTKEQIADRMGIARSTLDGWCKKCPDLSDAIKNRRAYAHARVENALYKKAIGYSYTTQEPVKIRTSEYRDGRKVKETEEVQLVEKTVVVPPDLGAIIFYLTNRVPEDWKNNRPYTDGEPEKDSRQVVFINDLGRSIAKELKAPEAEKDKTTDSQTDAT